MENIVPDTLVFKIEERDSGKTDTMLYILYDTATNMYVIRGKRSGRSYPYSFECKSAYDLVEFLECCVDLYNLYSYVIYNYDNLPAFANDITYSFLEEHQTRDREICGYDNQNFDRDIILKNLNILRNVFNYY
jgi:hypothetical protein